MNSEELWSAYGADLKFGVVWERDGNDRNDNNRCFGRGKPLPYGKSGMMVVVSNR